MIIFNELNLGKWNICQVANGKKIFNLSFYFNDGNGSPIEKNWGSEMSHRLFFITVINFIKELMVCHNYFLSIET